MTDIYEVEPYEDTYEVEVAVDPHGPGRAEDLVGVEGVEVGAGDDDRCVVGAVAHQEPGAGTADDEPGGRGRGRTPASRTRRRTPWQPEARNFKLTNAATR